MTATDCGGPGRWLLEATGRHCGDGDDLEQGTRNQILTMSYFNPDPGWEAFTGITAKKAFLKYASDPEILAAFMPTYLTWAEEYAGWAVQGASAGIIRGGNDLPLDSCRMAL